MWPLLGPIFGLAVLLALPACPDAGAHAQTTADAPEGAAAKPQAVTLPLPVTLLPPVSPACISSPFGPRRLVGPRAALFHNGIDFPAPAGVWVHVVASGQVVAVRRLGSEGLQVDVAHDLPGLGRVVTRYAHLGAVAPALATGRTGVAAGEAIGRIGRTGVTYGTHLHFELHRDGKPVDPEPYFAVKRCG